VPLRKQTRNINVTSRRPWIVWGYRSGHPAPALEERIGRRRAAESRGTLVRIAEVGQPAQYKIDECLKEG
jgi:hypothetical protein